MAIKKTGSGRLSRIATAALPGLFAIFVFSLGADQALHTLEAYPPWGGRMHDPGLNFLALACGSAHAVIGSYIATVAAGAGLLVVALAFGKRTEAARWLEDYRWFWERSSQRLDALLDDLKTQAT